MPYCSGQPSYCDCTVDHHRDDKGRVYIAVTLACDYGATSRYVAVYDPATGALVLNTEKGTVTFKPRRQGGGGEE